jgi:predicted permease
MSSVVTTILPFFILVVIGYSAARFSVLDAREIQGLNRFVYLFALPSLLFSKMADASFAQIVAEKNFVLAYVLAGVIWFAAGWFSAKLLFRADAPGRAVFGLSSCYGNIGFLGIPVLVSILGGWSAAPLSIMLLFDIGLFIPLSATCLAFSQSRQGYLTIWQATFRSIVKNPLIIAIVTGALFSALGWGLPDTIGGVTNILGQSAGPVAMLSLGAVLAGRPISEGLGEALFISLFKLLGFPFVVWWLMTAFGVGEAWRLAATLGAATPLAAALFIIAQEYKAMPARASTAVILSTALAILSMPLIIHLLK